MPDKEEIRPTDRVPVVVAGRACRNLCWGIPAEWDGKPLINARSETLESKKSFRTILDNRCLIPATAYFEWRRDGKNRFKNRIAPVDGGLFAFAGLFEGDHFTVITCDPLPGIAHIHNRMPVILDRGAEAHWIDPARPFAELRQSLSPFVSGPLVAEEEKPRISQPDLFAGS